MKNLIKLLQDILFKGKKNEVMSHTIVNDKSNNQELKNVDSEICTSNDMDGHQVNNFNNFKFDVPLMADKDAIVAIEADLSDSWTLISKKGDFNSYYSTTYYNEKEDVAIYICYFATKDIDVLPGKISVIPKEQYQIYGIPTQESFDFTSLKDGSINFGLADNIISFLMKESFKKDSDWEWKDVLGFLDGCDSVPVYNEYIFYNKKENLNIFISHESLRFGKMPSAKIQIIKIDEKNVSNGMKRVLKKKG